LIENENISFYIIRASAREFESLSTSNRVDAIRLKVLRHFRREMQMTIFDSELHRWNKYSGNEE